MTHEQGGNKSAEENTRQHKLIFDGKKFTIKQGDNVMASGTFTVDASKKPRHIDMKIEGGDDEKLQGKTSLGIYELDGDDLKWASNEPGAEGRPTDFTTKEGSKQMVVTLKRDKK
jgi:uncharacterized protein (TIGR03067 family)